MSAFAGIVRMASRPPPHFVVRRHDAAGNRRQRLGWALLWLGSILLTALLVGLLTRGVVPAVVDRQQQRALRAQLDDLRQQLANLQRAAQVNGVATRLLRCTLMQREEEISGLRADLGFYSRLVGGDAPQGLKVQEVKLQPIAGSRGWNVTLSLTQNAKRDEETRGVATLDVEGLRANRVVQLAWPALGDTAHRDGLPFELMYFEQLHGTIVLPADFRPTRLLIRIQPAGDAPVSRTIAWAHALGDNVTTAQGDHDVQP